MLTITHSAQRTIKDTLPYRGHPVFQLQKIPRLVSSSPPTFQQNLTIWDTVVNRETRAGSTYADDYKISSISEIDPNSFRSTTNATVDSSGQITLLRDGVLKIKCSVGGKVYGAAVQMARIYTQSTVLVDTFVQFVAGKLAAFLDSRVESRLTNPPTTIVGMHQFSPRLSYYQNNTRVARNPDCWLADVDLSFYSTQRTGGGGRFTLITPTVAVGSKHYLGSLSDTITWTGSDGSLHARTIVQRQDLFLGSDYTLVRLSAPLPSVVKPVKVIPNDYLSYFAPDASNGSTDSIWINVSPVEAPWFGVASWKVNKVVIPQDYKVVPVKSTGYGGIKSRSDNWRGLGHSGTSQYMVGGDSSSPQGFLFNNEFVLINLTFYPDGNGTSFLPKYADGALASMGSSSLSIADFTSFPRRA